MHINVNDFVRVRLSKEGKLVYDQYQNYINSELRKYGITAKPDEHPADSEGWSMWQLWELMAVFGSHISMGSPNMFDTDMEIVGH